MMLEVLHHLKDGGVRKVFFVGSMFGKGIPIGRLVLPTSVVDRAGIVLVDDSSRTTVTPDKSSVWTLKSALRRLNLQFLEAKIASVPCVIHGTKRVTEFIEDSADIEGVEMEASTFVFVRDSVCAASRFEPLSTDRTLQWFVRRGVIGTGRLVRESHPPHFLKNPRHLVGLWSSYAVLDRTLFITS
jgi:hypothetical protein